jgi:hypothetical protein
MKPRVRLAADLYGGTPLYICRGCMPNRCQHLETPGRTIEEATRLWYQVRDIYMGVPL